MDVEGASKVTTSILLASVTTVLMVLLTLKSLYTRRHILKFAKQNKGLSYYPIIGNGYRLLGKNSFVGIQEVIKDYGLPCNLWTGHDYYYMTADAAELKVILNHPSSFDKMKLYESFNLGFKNSLLMAPADVWKKHRKLYSRSFSQPMLNSFVHCFYKKSVILLDTLKESDSKDKFGIFERYAFDSFCESIFGIDYKLQTDPKVKLVDWISKLQVIMGKRILTNYFYPMSLFLHSREGKYALSLLENIKTFVYEAIRDKRKAFKENPVYVDCDTALPLVDAMLIAAGTEQFNDRQIFEEMFLFTTAATDTSGYTLAYLFTLLGMHPQIQENVYQEVMSTIGSDRPIYSDDLPKLKYTERTILESMRLLPVTPFLGRLATDDIDIGTKVIPKGANIFISVFDLHRDEKYWTNPLIYDPDRFLPEEVAKREPYSYIPFSGGNRNCLGKTYALMLMKTAVANVLRNYEIVSKYKSVEELKLMSCITMKTQHPLECRFKSRKHE